MNDFTQGKYLSILKAEFTQALQQYMEFSLSSWGLKKTKKLAGCTLQKIIFKILLSCRVNFKGLLELVS